MKNRMITSHHLVTQDLIEKIYSCDRGGNYFRMYNYRISVYSLDDITMYLNVVISAVLSALLSFIFTLSTIDGEVDTVESCSRNVTKQGSRAVRTGAHNIVARCAPG